jgi:hypothetical protein
MPRDLMALMRNRAGPARAGTPHGVSCRSGTRPSDRGAPHAAACRCVGGCVQKKFRPYFLYSIPDEPRTTGWKRVAQKRHSGPILFVSLLNVAAGPVSRIRSAAIS